MKQVRIIDKQSSFGGNIEIKHDYTMRPNCVVTVSEPGGCNEATIFLTARGLRRFLTRSLAMLDKAEKDAKR